MSPKMILTDLDKTLLCSDGNISEYTKRILKECQSRGIPVVIATARYWIGAERYIDELKPDYEITTDGTLIHRFGEEIYSSSMDAERANGIVQDLLQYNPQTEITVAAGRQVLWNSLHISESEKLHKAVYYDYSKPLSRSIRSSRSFPTVVSRQRLQRKISAACNATGEKTGMPFCRKALARYRRSMRWQRS